MSATATPDDVIAGRAKWCVVCGDSAAVLPSLLPESANAVVTDPPAGISFMGLEFDHNKGGRAQWVAWLASILALARAATKPGGRTFVWSLPRTSHWTGCAVEDAGWNIETTVSHLFGTGWPKGATQLKPAAETWWLARNGPPTPLEIDACRVRSAASAPSVRGTRTVDGTTGVYGRSSEPYAAGAEVTWDAHAAGRWPPNAVFSHSPSCVREGVRKVLANGQRNFVVARENGGIGYGSGAVGAETVKRPGTDPADGMESVDAWTCADGCPVAELAAQSGDLAPRGNVNPSTQGGGLYGVPERTSEHHSRDDLRDTGTAARFFPQFPADDPSEPFNAPLFTYIAKPSRAEKNAGCEDVEPSDAQRFAFKRCALCGKQPVNVPGSACVCVAPQWERAEVVDPARNDHATVKSVALMAWLIRLITKPGDVVLDPFCGSGTTGVAALLEGRRVILIERDPRYAEIARARCEHAAPSPERLRTMTSTPVRVVAPDFGPLFTTRDPPETTP